MTAEITLRQGRRSPGVITMVGSTVEASRAHTKLGRPLRQDREILCLGVGDSEDMVFRVQDHQGLPSGFISPSPFRY
jgi:hypothetical protein